MMSRPWNGSEPHSRKAVAADMDIGDDHNSRVIPMLVLSRKVGEQIRISDDIVITVVETRKGNVRLGIEVPRCVSVNREEILQAIRKGVA